MEASSKNNAKYIDLCKSGYLFPVCLYFLIYAGSYVAITTSLLTYGSLSGNIHVTLTCINFMELALGLAGGYISALFSLRRSLICIFLFLGIGYLLYERCPPLIQFVIVVQGKMLTDMTWILLGVLAYSVVPDRFYPLVVSSRCVFNLAVSAVFSYGKYWLEAAGLSVFLFSGLYELGVVAAILAIKESKSPEMIGNS